MAGNARWQKVTNCNKFIAAFYRNLKLVRMQLISLAEWLRGWCLSIFRLRMKARKRDNAKNWP